MKLSLQLYYKSSVFQYAFNSGLRLVSSNKYRAPDSGKFFQKTFIVSYMVLQAIVLTPQANAGFGNSTSLARGNLTLAHLAFVAKGNNTGVASRPSHPSMVHPPPSRANQLTLRSAAGRTSVTHKHFGQQSRAHPRHYTKGGLSQGHRNAGKNSSQDLSQSHPRLTYSPRKSSSEQTSIKSTRQNSGTAPRKVLITPREAARQQRALAKSASKAVSSGKPSFSTESGAEKRVRAGRKGARAVNFEIERGMEAASIPSRGGGRAERAAVYKRQAQQSAEILVPPMNISAYCCNPVEPSCTALGDGINYDIDGEALSRGGFLHQ